MKLSDITQTASRCDESEHSYGRDDIMHLLELLLRGKSKMNSFGGVQAVDGAIQKALQKLFLPYRKKVSARIYANRPENGIINPVEIRAHMVVPERNLARTPWELTRINGNTSSITCIYTGEATVGAYSIPAAEMGEAIQLDLTLQFDINFPAETLNSYNDTVEFLNSLIELNADSAYLRQNAKADTVQVIAS
jgi:hypothetical protein